MTEEKKHYSNLEALLNLTFPIHVTLAEKEISVDEALNFTVGSIIIFKKHNSEPLDLHVNNQKIGNGKTIKVGERFGLHVREIKSPQETFDTIAEN